MDIFCNILLYSKLLDVCIKTKGVEMSVVKKWSLVAVMIVVIAGMVFMAGCGGSKTESASTTASGGGEVKATAVEAGETTAAAEETKAASNVKGETYDTEKFSILAPEGWEKMDIPGGVQLYKGNDIMQVSVSGSNVTEAEDKALLEDMSKQYNGTALEEVTMFGVKFFKTSYTANGSDQTMYSGVRNGEQVKIQMSGKDHQNNEAIIAMLESISLK
jgi:hypothetical protein